MGKDGSKGDKCFPPGHPGSGTGTARWHERAGRLKGPRLKRHQGVVYLLLYTMRLRSFRTAIDERELNQDQGQDRPHRYRSTDVHWFVY